MTINLCMYAIQQADPTLQTDFVSCDLASVYPLCASYLAITLSALFLAITLSALVTLAIILQYSTFLSTFSFLASGSEFEVSWKRLKGNAAGKEEFLRQLDPLQLPTLFKQSLTAPVLQGVALSALDMMMAQNDHFGIQLLENLKCVPRFDMIVMSLPRREKAELREHYDAAQNAPVVDSVLAKRLESVRRSYRV